MRWEELVPLLMNCFFLDILLSRILDKILSKVLKIDKCYSYTSDFN